MFEQNSCHRGISPNFAEPGCSTMKTCPKACASQQSNVTLVAMTFPIFTLTHVSSPKGVNQYLCDWLTHMKEKELQTGASSMRLPGCKRKRANTFSVHTSPKIRQTNFLDRRRVPHCSFVQKLGDKVRKSCRFKNVVVTTAVVVVKF